VPLAVSDPPGEHQDTDDRGEGDDASGDLLICQLPMCAPRLSCKRGDQAKSRDPLHLTIVCDRREHAR
jgi:hypothetical protein